MRNFTIMIILTLLAIHGTALSAAADTRYVTDQLVITLRQGKGTEYKIIKTLKTGTPLEVLAADDTYLKVRTADGTEGYVLRQYVTSHPPKEQQLKELQQRNTALGNKVRSLEEAKSNLDNQLRTLRENYDREQSAITAKSTDLEQNLEQALNQQHIMTEKYNTLLAQSENVVKIAAEHDQLALQNRKLKADVAALAEKNDKLADSRMIRWFLAGGGVFFLGWIIGKISRKKRSRY